MSDAIRVSAVVMRDPEGRVLNVRKRGTSTLMLPGGKPEPGEDPRDTAIREFAEELGVQLDPLRLRGLGEFRSPAANEPGRDVVAHVFEHPFVAVDRPLAEIEHLEWVDPTQDHPAMAPLNTEHVFPALAAGIRAPQRLAVFTGSALGNSPEFASAAREFGAAMAHAGIDLVYGGGKVGLMGTVADAVLANDGEVFGVITESLLAGETGHTGLTRLEVVSSMPERKRRMAELTDAFVALPGGPGTLEEIFEVWTWATLGIHQKPVAIFDVNGYWQPLLAALDAMVEAGFSSPAARASLIVATDPAELFTKLAAWQPPRPKWS
ncbi:TIGR00730 family Rossman fold protein [Leucobacter sp. G161]|uniref:TIGR00730 family Rossman fold protein n=1 Tax=Leucobacter sp. G161 TaxID=663704 RepID=UPI000ACDFBDD|nr:TIGR00730 family Rossman fold protein [Leucobacter sp. G161]